MWDVVVVGGGPAGSSAALAARRAHPDAAVLLLDRAAFPRDKACGDGIAPHAIDVLSGLSVDWKFPAYRPVRGLELSSHDRSVARLMRRDAWVIPRYDFDHLLWQQAQTAGVQVAQHRVRAVTLRDSSVVLDDCIEAKVVIAADGAHSGVRRATGEKVARAGPTALALRGYAPTPPARQGKQVIVFSSIRQPAYAWSFDRGDGWSNVGYGEVLTGDAQRTSMTKSMMIDQLERLLPGAGGDGSSWRAAPLPLSGPGFSHPRGRILYAGDAAHLVNPLTGEGIYYGVLTGSLAGEIAGGADAQGGTVDPGRAYGRRVRKHLHPHLHTTAAVSRLATSSKVLSVGLAAAAADQSAFDDLVEVGLGRGTVTRQLLGSLLRAAARSV